jgi:hypothetical protein
MGVLIITCVFIFGFFSPCLCQRLNLVTTNNNIFNVMEYGARGDGKTDDSNVYTCFFVVHLISIYFILHFKSSTIDVFTL